MRARALFLILLCSCASEKYLKNPGHSTFERRDYARAADEFGKDAKKPSSNQVLFILDQATSLFANQDFEGAIPLFLQAEKLAEIKDYTSLSEEVGVLATGENVRGYKGEDFEKILINVYLAMAFAAIGKLEDAQVEARKINLILYRMITEGKRNYQESPFARYFSALMWEANRDWNDAYIDYKKTAELDPAFPEIGRDLLNISQKMHFAEEYREWQDKYPHAKPRSLKAGEGEVVVIFEQGRSPIKVPRDGQDSVLPRFQSRSSLESGARLMVNGQAQGSFERVLDIDLLSKSFLEDRIARMKAAKVAGLVTKGALAYGIGKMAKSEDLGWLAFFVMAASDRADLRCWKTLPAELKMLRLPLKAGRYHLQVDVLTGNSTVLRSKDFGEIEVKAGKKRIFVAR